MSVAIKGQPPAAPRPAALLANEEGRSDWVSDPNVNAVVRDIMEILSELISQNEELRAEVKHLKEFHAHETSRPAPGHTSRPVGEPRGGSA